MIATFGLLLALLLPGVALGYSSGVPVGLTGAPGEGTCASCHGDLNTGMGGISITAPLTCAPGETLDITVDMHHMGMQMWGFELTCLDGAGEPAGEFICTDPDRTQLDTDGDTGREYMMHTADGTDDGYMNMCLGWSFQWVAPEDYRSEMTFYASGVAANSSQGSNGDYAYADLVTSILTPVDEMTWSQVKALYR
jgi:hypothetical protein